ncbi:hypothetical protein K501DRAFT_217885, partial [Backusella circina FSU 941]
MSSVLECRVVRKTGDICIAQYLPRVLKDEYFGIFSILGYNISRCYLTQSRELELLLFMSLLILLDKSDNNSWKRDPISKGIKEDTTLNDSVSNGSTISGAPFEYPIPEKALRKKIKAERNIEQKLKVMIEKGVRKSQKQLQSDFNTNQPRKKSFDMSIKSDISSSSSIDTPKDNHETVGALTQLFLEMGNLRHEEYPITPPILSPSSATNSRSRSDSEDQNPMQLITNNLFTTAIQENPSEQSKGSFHDTDICSYKSRLPFRDNQRGSQRYVYSQQSYPSGEFHNFSTLSLSSSSRRPRLLPDQRRSSASDYIGNLSHQYDHSFDPHGIYNRLSLSEFRNGN